MLFIIFLLIFITIFLICLLPFVIETNLMAVPVIIVLVILFIICIMQTTKSFIKINNEKRIILKNGIECVAKVIDIFDVNTREDIMIEFDRNPIEILGSGEIWLCVLITENNKEYKYYVSTGKYGTCKFKIGDYIDVYKYNSRIALK